MSQHFFISFETKKAFDMLNLLVNIINEKQRKELDIEMAKHSITYRPIFLMSDFNKGKNDEKLWTNGIDNIVTHDFKTSVIIFGANGMRSIYVNVEELESNSFKISLSMHKCEENDLFLLMVAQELVDNHDVVIMADDGVYPSLVTKSKEGTWAYITS